MHYLSFDLDLGVKVTRNVAQCPLHHVTCSATTFEVATPKSLGGDTFTRNLTDCRNVFVTKLIYLFLKKKTCIKKKIVSEYDQEIPH